jgi:hypothetical protein
MCICSEVVLEIEGVKKLHTTLDIRESILEKNSNIYEVHGEH